MAVVSCFGTAGNMHMAGSGGMLTFGEGKTAELPREVQATIEKLLVAELDDTAEQIGVSGSWNGKSFTDPRICDVAANVLSELKPRKYRFDLGAPLMQRDRNIVELKNVWRAVEGMPPLPLPRLREVARVPDDQLRGLLDKLLQAADADRRKVEMRIEALGLGALPGTLEQIKRTRKKADQTVLAQIQAPPGNHRGRRAIGRWPGEGRCADSVQVHGAERPAVRSREVREHHSRIAQSLTKGGSRACVSPSTALETARA